MTKPDWISVGNGKTDSQTSKGSSRRVASADMVRRPNDAGMPFGTCRDA